MPWPSGGHDEGDQPKRDHEMRALSLHRHVRRLSHSYTLRHYFPSSSSVLTFFFSSSSSPCHYSIFFIFISVPSYPLPSLFILFFSLYFSSFVFFHVAFSFCSSTHFNYRPPLPHFQCFRWIRTHRPSVWQLTCHPLHRPSTPGAAFFLLPLSLLKGNSIDPSLLFPPQLPPTISFY